MPLIGAYKPASSIESSRARCAVFLPGESIQLESTISCQYGWGLGSFQRVTVSICRREVWVFNFCSIAFRLSSVSAQLTFLTLRLY
jgi:hypothetical protein